MYKVYINNEKISTNGFDIDYSDRLNELYRLLREKKLEFTVTGLTDKVINAGFEESNSIVLKTVDNRYLGYNEAIKYIQNYVEKEIE